eukprot:1708738-Rhodomonas_salina.1
MFESLVANAISSRLSQVLKNIDAERLKIGIWKGEVVLKDLELRTDCLDGAGLLPFLRELLLLVVALVRTAPVRCDSADICGGGCRASALAASRLRSFSADLHSMEISSQQTGDHPDAEDGDNDSHERQRESRW